MPLLAIPLLWLAGAAVAAHIGGRVRGGIDARRGGRFADRIATGADCGRSPPAHWLSPSLRAQ